MSHILDTVWGYCNETLLDKLQVLQNKAARVIKGSKFENTNHPVLLKELCWLNVRQLIFIDTAILMYRVANNLAPEPISDMYQLANNVHNYNTRYASDGNFYLNRSNTTKGQRSTNFSGVESQLLLKRLSLWYYSKHSLRNTCLIKNS